MCAKAGIKASDWMWGLGISKKPEVYHDLSGLCGNEVGEVVGDSHLVKTWVSASWQPFGFQAHVKLKTSSTEQALLK